jgi:predicted nucleic acid-binding Zn ribbon protein
MVHSLHAEGPKFCPSCGAEDSMRKAFAPPAIHFKGSGWAKKDRSHRAPTKAAGPSGGDKDAQAPTAAASGDGASPSGEGSGPKAGASTGSSSAAVD